MQHTTLKTLGLLLVLAGAGAARENFASSGYAVGGAAYLDMPAHGDSAGLSRAVTAW